MNVTKVIQILNNLYPTLPLEKIAATPFKTLIATLISQRARDDQTMKVVEALFKAADNPKRMLELSNHKLEKILQPSGKQKQNSGRIKIICKILLKKYSGRVPGNETDLLSFPGVGRKTANIVLSHSFKKQVVAVDIHVHRITNRIGWINTKNAEETERQLKKLIPKKYWRSINRVFVRHGQTVCRPISPWCSKCKISKYCKKTRVIRQR